MKPANAILSSYGTTIFTVMSALAAEHQAINLGQGFPDVDGPEDVRRVAAEALMAGPNQYPPMTGLAELRQAVADHDQRFYGLTFDPNGEVLVTSGATEALASALFGLIEPGDEVVLIEPLYDSYLPIIRRAGGVPRLVRIEPPHWQLPRQALADAMGPRTKLLLLNSPHNPASKVFDDSELSFLAQLLERHDAYAVCDEVYEHLVFDGRQHRPLMTFPGMSDRCVRIGSAGKTFSLTGWKVGYVTATRRLLEPVAKAHQFLTFTTPPHLQKAVAYGLAKDQAYFDTLAHELEGKRDRLANGLTKLGMSVMESQGSYFITADFRPLGFTGNDTDFCRLITSQAGVAAVPVSAFYQQADVDHFVRFCFCKRQDVLDEAIARLTAFFASGTVS